METITTARPPQIIINTPTKRVVLPKIIQGEKGNSAYEIWLSLGNTGTELQFLQSLISVTENKVYKCGENINSHTPVVLVGGVLFRMDNTNQNHQFAFVGFTKTSGITGNDIGVATEEIELSGWQLVQGAHYLAGPNGTLIISNSVPGSFTKIIGYATTTDKLLIIKDYISINK